MGKIRKEIGRILFSDIGDLAKEVIYGKPLYVLDIRPKITTNGLDKDIIDYLYWVQEQGYRRGYFGSHIVTSRGILIKEKNSKYEIFKRLEKKVTDYDLGMLGSSGDILNLDIVDSIPITDYLGFLNPQMKPKKVGKCIPHIHIDNKVYHIKKTRLGLQLA